MPLIEASFDSLVFLVMLAVHVAAGVTCVVTGIVAMLSTKRPGGHPRFGTAYYRALTAVFTTATVLSALRWAENYHLFIIGSLAFAAATLGRTALRHRWRRWVRLHICGMGLSYILMLTAFYVDNGPKLPLWKDLPPSAYWLLPSAIGIPLILCALLRHPLVRHPKGPAQDVI
jgi:hypothetical protein